MNEKIMEILGFGKVVTVVKQNRCPFCGKFVEEEEFRDKLSLKDFKISGLCQKCQDKVYGGEDDICA
jgi:hypothetical protein